MINTQEIILNLEKYLTYEQFNILKNFVENLSIIEKAKLEKYVNENYMKTNISTCIMVKNQENKIIETIKSIEHISDNIYITDTGSIDNTVKEIEKLNNDKIKLSYSPWQENFALMRNISINTVNDDDWILIIDSDETLKTSLTQKSLKLILTSLKYIYGNRIILTAEIYNGFSSGFTRPQRIFSKKDNYFYGLVHEEIRNNKGIRDIPTKISFFNSGVASSELKKFNKINRYNELLNNMLNIEPNNPRWFSLMDVNELTKYPIKSEKQFNKFLLINPTEGLSKSNIIKSKYVKELLLRYASFEFNLKNYKKVSLIGKIGLELYPNNTNMILFKYIGKEVILGQKYNELLQKIVKDEQSIDKNSSFEESQQNDDLVSALVIKLLIKLGEYSIPKKIIKNISDPMAIDMLEKEYKLLN